MKLETKYGVLEGTVKEFRELLKGKVSKSWSFPSKGYKVVNKNTDNEPTKGTVLKHIILNNYEDTLGNQYIIYDDVLDDCNDISIGDLFKSSKDRGTLLKQGIDKPTYKIVNKDNVVSFLDLNKKLPKGLVLEHKGEDAYEDTLGVRYLLYAKDLDDYDMSWVDGKFKSFKDKKLLLTQKEEYKVVKEDLYSNLEGLVMMKKGTILIHCSLNTYKDSLGNAYRLSSDIIENKLEGVYGASVGFNFEEHKLNHKLYKVELP